MNIYLKKPLGFYYFPDFISAEEEKSLLAHFSKFTWEDIKMHGLIAKRRVVHFGLNYTYTSRTAKPGKPPPQFLEPFIERVAKQMNKNYKEIVQILITEYPVGSGIGWHKDASIFGNVFGISLLGSSLFKLRLKTVDAYEVFKLNLTPRSGYILSEESRTNWQHCISSVKHKRYSITFRTLAEKKVS